jgi:hypothetical protein
MTTPRQWAVAATLPGGDVLIAGGSDSSGHLANSFLASAEVFKPAALANRGTTGLHHQVGRIRLVTCEQVTGNPATKKRSRSTCSTKLITVNARLTTGDRAVLIRNRLIYASGQARNGRLTMSGRRRVTPGHYTLTLKHLSDGRWTATHYRITVD